MNEPIAEYPIDGSRMDRITWIYVRAWPEETERGGASFIPDNHVRAVGKASASPGWRDGPLLRARSSNREGGRLRSQGRSRPSPFFVLSFGRSVVRPKFVPATFHAELQ